MFLGRNWDFVEMNKVSQTIQSPFPSVWMGGSILKIDEAEKSGAWGGFMVGVIFFITTLILFANNDKIARLDVPMLAIAKEVNPIFATTLRLCDFWYDFQYRL